MKPRCSTRIAFGAVFLLLLLLVLRFSKISLYQNENHSPNRSQSVAHKSRLTADSNIGASARSSSLTDFQTQIRQRLIAWKAETDPIRRQAIEDELVGLLTAANAGEIVRGLSPDLLETPFGEIALTRWAASDRRAAGDWMAHLPGAIEDQAGLVTYGWLTENRTGLHAYIDSLIDGSTWKQSIIKTATNDALVLKDGAEAISLLLRLPPQTQRDEMLGWATTEWAIKEPERAAEWSRDLPDGPLQSKLFNAAIVGYAWRNPGKAAQLLVTASESGNIESATITSVMSIWSHQDPDAATRWAAQSLTDSTQALAIRTALTAWGYQDFSAAETWMKSLGDSSLRTQAEHTLRKVDAALHGIELSDDPSRSD